MNNLVPLTWKEWSLRNKMKNNISIIHKEWYESINWKLWFNQSSKYNSRYIEAFKVPFVNPPIPSSL